MEFKIREEMERRKTAYSKTDWYDTLIVVVVIIAVCYVILNVVTLIEVAGLIN